jgi:hypothetical protein
MAEQDFKPGDLVPKTGVYRVLHHEHRAAHEATLRKHQHFPACARCGQLVRFWPAALAGSIEEDADFRRPATRTQAAR